MEKEKITKLLNYFIEHNREHSQELTDLAGKVSTVANNAVREYILEAARLMNRSTEYLKQASMKLSTD